jgi:micrococcal nuclease
MVALDREHHMSKHFFKPLALAGVGMIVIGFIVWKTVFSVPTVKKEIPIQNPRAPRMEHGFVVATSTNAFVVRAVDGDTLLVKVDGESQEQRVRMLGINTPETVDPRKAVQCFGKDASKHMHALVDGKRIRLEADPLADERDKYGRLLRNVFLADGTDVNAMMVRDGYAYAYLSFPLNPLRRRALKKLEEDAKLAQRGLWNPNTCNGKT